MQSMNFFEKSSIVLQMARRAKTTDYKKTKYSKSKEFVITCILVVNNLIYNLPPLCSIVSGLRGTVGATVNLQSVSIVHKMARRLKEMHFPVSVLQREDSDL